VNRVNGISFAIADPKKYQSEARLKALRAAREKAIAMATELGQTIGKPWEVTEATANWSLREEQLSAPAIAGGEVIVQAAVRVRFQLE